VGALKNNSSRHKKITYFVDVLYGWCYFPSNGRTKSRQPHYFLSMVDVKEDSLSAIFRPHGTIIFYSHTTYG